MTTLNTQDQIPELTDEQLEAAHGGFLHQQEAVGANETCRTTYDPAGGVRMVCYQ